MLITRILVILNKNGTIVLLDNDTAASDVICNGLKALGHRNEILCFDDSEAVAQYLADNQLNVFLLMQSTTSPGVQVPDTRNMIFMHESFNTDNVPYSFLVLTKQRLLTGRLHTFVHCYYKPAALSHVIETLTGVVDFWKDHVFPPRVEQHN